MIFLIEYDRRRGRLIRLDSFEDTHRSVAERIRLDIELDLHYQQVDHEVVLLQAATEAALRRAHRRYFEKASEIARSAGIEVRNLSFVVDARAAGDDASATAGDKPGAREPRSG